jgi:putative redox protein
MAAMKTRVKWIEDRTFLGQSGSGHSVIMGGAATDAGPDAGVRPMEMLLLGLGGCTAYDVVDILEKSRQPVTDVAIEIEGERAEDIPKVFTEINVRYIVTGTGLDPAKVERAVSLSADKYCSATVMLGASATISHEIEIVDSRES